jgi:hypothetical protein
MKILPVSADYVQLVWYTTQAVQTHCYSFVEIVEAEDSRMGVAKVVRR